MKARITWESGLGSILSVTVIHELQEFHLAVYSTSEKEGIKEKLMQLAVQMETNDGGGGGVGEEEMLLQTHYNAVRELYRSKNYFLVVGGPGE